MERVVRTVEVDGHTVDVVEVIDDNEAWWLLTVNDVVVNADAPLAVGAGDDEIRAAVRFWAERS